MVTMSITMIYEWKEIVSVCSNDGWAYNEGTASTTTITTTANRTRSSLEQILQSEVFGENVCQHGREG